MLSCMVSLQHIYVYCCQKLKFLLILGHFLVVVVVVSLLKPKKAKILIYNFTLLSTLILMLRFSMLKMQKLLTRITNTLHHFGFLSLHTLTTWLVNKFHVLLGSYLCVFNWKSLSEDDKNRKMLHALPPILQSTHKETLLVLVPGARTAYLQSSFFKGWSEKYK